MDSYRIVSFLKFYFQASTRYNVHSEFIFDFVEKILDTSKIFYDFEKIENERKKLLNNNNVIQIKDFGAGSSINKNNQKTVREIANQAVSPKEKCRIIFNAVNHFQPKKILELGTSLGISSAYMALSATKSEIITVEGDPKISKIAQEVHKSLSIKNTKIICAKFNDALAEIINNGQKFDFIYIDGHHEKTAVLSYVESLLVNIDEETVICIDDIYWSKGMNEAWKMLCNNNKITLSIDLHQVGFLFVNQRLSKQNIKLIPYHYKPYNIGLFG